MPDLGWEPLTGYNPVLVTDNDFILGFTTPTGSPLPSGAVVTMVLGGGLVSWPANVVTTAQSSSVSWNVDKLVVNAAIATLGAGMTRTAALINYTDSAGLDLTWTTGKVKFVA